MLKRLRHHLVGDGRLGEREFECLASRMQPHHLDKGRPLLVPGEVCSYQAFVSAGCLRVYFIDEDASERVLYFAPEGWWATDIESFVSGAPSRLAIDAIERADMLVIDKANVDQLRVHVPRIESLLRRLREQTLVSVQRRLIAALHKTAIQRYHAFRRQYPNLEGRIPQYQIAAYVGISPEFLSTLRRRAGREK